MKFLSNPLAMLAIGIVIGAKTAGKVNSLPLISKIPSI